MSKKAFFLFCLFILFSLSVFSISTKQKRGRKAKIHIHNEIVVTATRTKTKLKSIGNTVTVISHSQLLENNYQTVAEALESVPGLQLITNGSEGHVTTVMIRGAKSDQTLVLIDGMELNDPMSPSRGFDLGNMTLDNVERIEIIRGPQSTLYGSDAMGGVINIITRTGEGKPEADFSIEVGKYNTWKIQSGVIGEEKGLSYAFSMSRTDTDGFSAADYHMGNLEADGWRNVTFNGNLGYEITRDLNAKVSLYYSDGRMDLDNWGGPFGDDSNYKQISTLASAKAMLKYEHPSGLWRQSISLSYTDNERNYKNDTDTKHPDDSSNALYKGIMRKFTWQNTFVPDRWQVVTIGYEYQREDGHSAYHSLSAWGAFDSEFIGKHTTTNSIYAEDQVGFSEIFFLTGGLRIDHHDVFGNDTNFKISPVIIIPKTGTRIHFSVGTGFKAPSLYQLYAPPSSWGNVGNKNLKPENNWAIDGGFDQYFYHKTMFLNVTAFYNHFDDLIDFTNGYQNVGRVKTEGLEFITSWHPCEMFKLDFNYTYTNAKNLETGEELLRRAHNTLFARFALRPAKPLKFICQWAFKGKRLDMNYSTFPATRKNMDGYHNVDISFLYRIYSNLEIFCKIHNLFDSDTEEIYGYGREAFAAYGGIKVSLK